MKQALFGIVAGIILFIPLYSCNSSGSQKRSVVNSTGQASQNVVTIPVFDGDSAWLFCKSQTDFGPRVPQTKAHLQCAEYLHQKLQSYGAITLSQHFQANGYDGKSLAGINIIGSFNPDRPRRILLCAHWDSRAWADHDPLTANHKKPVMGANDGASGVGVLLEIARHLSAASPRVGVDILFFDLEDQGTPEFGKAVESHPSDYWCLGSQYWAQRPHVEGYRAQYGILLDMVGRKDALFYRDQVSDYFAKPIVDKVWSKASALGFSTTFINAEGGTITDDHLFINQIASIPTIDIIDYNPTGEKGFFRQWHTVDDTLEKLDRMTLTKVGQTLLKVIYEE